MSAYVDDTECMLLSSSGVLGVGMKSVLMIESLTAVFTSSPGRLIWLFPFPGSTTTRLSSAPANCFQTTTGLVILPRNGEYASWLPVRRKDGHSPALGNLPFRVDSLFDFGAGA